MTMKSIERNKTLDGIS